MSYLDNELITQKAVEKFEGPYLLPSLLVSWLIFIIGFGLISKQLWEK